MNIIEEKRPMLCEEDMRRELNSIEEAEQRRIELQERQEKIEITCFHLNTQRFQFVKTVHNTNTEFENRRFYIENRRME